VHEGKIYIFGSDECHKKFQADPPFTSRPALRCLQAPADATRGRQFIDGRSQRRWRRDAR
jgi:hypothetical protein